MKVIFDNRWNKFFTTGLIIVLMIFIPVIHIRAESNFVFNNNLKLGNHSQDVQELQKFLNTHGYLVSSSGFGSSGNETTYFGSKTKSAVILFQKVNKINPIGIVGPATRGMLNKINSGVSTFKQENVTGQYSIGGNISGLVGEIILQNNNGDNIELSQKGNSDFVFSKLLNPGDNYNIAIKPIYLGQKCFVENGSGLVKNSNINNVRVICTPVKLISGNKLSTNTKQRKISVSDPIVTKSKIYDENTTASVVVGTLSGVVNSDDVTLTAEANYDNANVGVGKTITVVYTIEGADVGKYIKPSDYVVNDGEIIAVEAATPTFSPALSYMPLTLALQGDTSSVGTEVQITSDTSDSEIYYTDDGSDPTASSTLYTGAFNLNQDTTLKAIAVKDNYLNSSIGTSDYNINQSPSGTFTNPHGTVQVGDKLYIGTRTSPATVTVFNDPDDLTDFETVSLTGHSNLDYLIYDSVNNKLYASCYDDDEKITIIKINPDNLSEWSVVYKDTYNYWAAPIVTDGTYVYGVTYGSNPSAFFKIRISDWKLYALILWSDNLGSGSYPNTYWAHSVSMVSYADRKEIYVTTVWDAPARFAKVNLNGSMSYTSISLGDSYTMSDDTACRYVDETGSFCYFATDVGYEGYATEKTGFKVDTRNMTFTKFSIGGEASLGMFAVGNDLYSMGVGNKIIRYQNFDTTAPEIFSIPSIVPNELLYSSDGSMYITDWQDPNPSKIIEIKFSS